MIELEEELTGALRKRARAVNVEDNLDAVLDDARILRFDDSLQSHPRHGRLLTAAAATAILAGMGGLVWANTERTETPAASAGDVPTRQGSTWVPAGEEFPSVDLGPATVADAGPVVAQLTRQVGIEGHPPQVITRSLAYRGHATADEEICTREIGGGVGCRGLDRGITWLTGETSSVDNGVADDNLWIVEGLPADVEFVSYQAGGHHLWQRPVHGFAAFPSTAGSDEVVIAYDAAGNEIGRFGDEQQAAVVAHFTPQRRADVSVSEFAELKALTHDETRRCLTAHGARFDSDIATFDTGTDPAAVWDQCVTDVQAVVEQAVSHLAPRFYDPATERPANPDPPLLYLED